MPAYHVYFTAILTHFVCDNCAYHSAGIDRRCRSVKTSVSSNTSAMKSAQTLCPHSTVGVGGSSTVGVGGRRGVINPDKHWCKTHSVALLGLAKAREKGWTVTG